MPGLPSFRRAPFVRLRDRLAEPRRFIQVVSGPRQVGKSTLVRQVLAELAMRVHAVSAETHVRGSWRALILESQSGDIRISAACVVMYFAKRNNAELIVLLFKESRNAVHSRVKAIALHSPPNKRKRFCVGEHRPRRSRTWHEQNKRGIQREKNPADEG